MVEVGCYNTVASVLRPHPDGVDARVDQHPPEGLHHMQLRSSRRRGALAALGLTLVVVAAACGPMPPPATTTTTTTTSSTTTTTVGPQDPVAVATATPTAPGFFGLPVAFSAAGSNDPDGGSIVSVLWDFGVPGQTSTNPTPNFTYRQPGNYSVTLTVTDDEGATGSTTISVNQPAPIGDVVLSSNPVAVPALDASAPVKVWWNNQAAGQLIYVDICRKPSTDPTFQPGLDCAPLSSQTPNGTASGSGVATVDVFRGVEPSGDLPWGCFAASDPAIPGIEMHTTCYVRVTNQSLFNTTAAKDVAFTITG